MRELSIYIRKIINMMIAYVTLKDTRRVYGLKIWMVGILIRICSIVMMLGKEKRDVASRVS